MLYTHSKSHKPVFSLKTEGLNLSGEFPQFISPHDINNSFLQRKFFWGQPAKLLLFTQIIKYDFHCNVAIQQNFRLSAGYRAGKCCTTLLPIWLIPPMDISVRTLYYTCWTSYDKRSWCYGNSKGSTSVCFGKDQTTLSVFYQRINSRNTALFFPLLSYRGHTRWLYSSFTLLLPWVLFQTGNIFFDLAFSLKAKFKFLYNQP